MIYKLPSIESADLNGKIVAVRANLDTLVNPDAPESNQIIKSIISTLNFLLSKKCKVIVMGTLGNPKGQIDDTYSLMDARFAIGHLINKPTKFVNILNSLNSIKFMNPGELLILENLKFCPEEVSNHSADWKKMTEHLAKLIDVLVLDTVDIDYTSGSLKYLMTKKPTYLGYGLQKEILSLKGFVNAKENSSKILILGNESDIDLNDKTTIEFLNKFEYIYSEKILSEKVKSSIIKSVGDLKEKITESKSVIWIGALEKDTQDILEYLSLSVGKEITKVLGGRNLVEIKINSSSFLRSN